MTHYNTHANEHFYEGKGMYEVCIMPVSESKRKQKWPRAYTISVHIAKTESVERVVAWRPQFQPLHERHCTHHPFSSAPVCAHAQYARIKPRPLISCFLSPLVSERTVTRALLHWRRKSVRDDTVPAAQPAGAVCAARAAAVRGASGHSAVG